MTEPLLSVAGLVAGYGDVEVLHGVDLAVRPGEIVCLIGSNGAGKTTTLRTLSGVAERAAGLVTFRGETISGSSPQTIARRGLVHVPEGRRLFAGMTVRENLLMGCYFRRDRAGIRSDLDFILTVFPRLGERLGQDAVTLSGGEQQMCAIGRGLMARPALLMIDELSLGLAPKFVADLGLALREINRRGVAILLVEQDVATALTLAMWGFVLDTGRIALSGATHELATDDRVREAYLGLSPTIA